MSFDALTVYLITFLYLNPLRLQSLTTFISLYDICLPLTLDFYFCQDISICLGHYLCWTSLCMWLFLLLLLVLPYSTCGWALIVFYGMQISTNMNIMLRENYCKFWIRIQISIKCYILCLYAKIKCSQYDCHSSIVDNLGCVWMSDRRSYRKVSSSLSLLYTDTRGPQPHSTLQAKQRLLSHPCPHPPHRQGLHII